MGVPVTEESLGESHSRRLGGPGTGRDLVEQGERVLYLRRDRAAARFQSLTHHYPQHEQQTGHQRAAKKQKEDLAVVEADFDLVPPAFDVAKSSLIHRGTRSVTHALLLRKSCAAELRR